MREAADKLEWSTIEAIVDCFETAIRLRQEWMKL